MRHPIVINSIPLVFDRKKNSKGTWRTQEQVGEIRNGVRYDAPAGAVRRPLTTSPAPQRLFLSNSTSQITPFTNATVNLQVARYYIKTSPLSHYESLQEKVSDFAVSIRKSNQELINNAITRFEGMITEKVKEAVEEKAMQTENMINQVAADIRDQNTRMEKFEKTQSELQQTSSQQQQVLTEMFSYFKSLNSDQPKQKD